MKKPLITAALAVAVLSTAACANGPYEGSHGYYGGQRGGACFTGERRDDCRERLKHERESHRRYVWRNDHYESDDTAGAAVAGGIIGFVLGAAIVGSSSDRDYYYAHRNDRQWRNRCSTSHPGFDHRTGTYRGSDGYRRYCTR